MPAKLEWEKLEDEWYESGRAKVPGGWLVVLDVEERITVVFVPDPEHAWK